MLLLNTQNDVSFDNVSSICPVKKQKLPYENTPLFAFSNNHI